MEMVNVCLLGQKDHGKSTLIGRLLVDTHSIEEDRIEDVKEASRKLGKDFEFAFLLDSFEEERDGGLTIDTIQLPIQWNGRRYGLIDVPGHRELIKNMLTGSSRSRYAILIVDVTEGIQPQTKEHLFLAKMVGIEKVIVVVNKMDEVGYDKGEFEKISGKITQLLNEAGFSSEIVIPISAKKGETISSPSKNMEWYDGYLLSMMETEFTVPPQTQGELRIPVQGVYTKENSRIVMGRVESGRIQKGDDVVFAPSQVKGNVKTIIVAGQETEEASAGQNVGILLDRSDGIERGDVCSHTSLGVEDNPQVKIISLETLSGRITVECGTASVGSEVGMLKMLVPTVTTVKLERPIVMESSGPLRRFVIKKGEKIVGIGLRGSF